LPFLLDRSAGSNGSLVGHLARANPQWEQLEGKTVLAVFSGAHAYISPTWYEAENVVPTWNYAAVHVYGKLRLIQDEPTLMNIVRAFVQHYEGNMPKPWSFDDSSSFAKKLIAQIVGFRIEIERIEGKWKLNQNHPVQRRKKVISALRQQGGANAEAVAEMMEKTISSEV
jgi:transcriptional regulator